MSLGLAVERKRQRIGLLGRIGEEAEDQSVGSCRGKEMVENRCFIFVWEEGNGRASKESVKREGSRVVFYFFLFYYFLFNFFLM